MKLIQFLADEDIDHDLVRGVLHRNQAIDFVTVQQLGLAGQPDSEILMEAVRENRIVVSHDIRTMPPAATKLMAEGIVIPGLVIIRKLTPMRQWIEDLVLIAEAGSASDWVNVIDYIPF